MALFHNVKEKTNIGVCNLNSLIKINISTKRISWKHHFYKIKQETLTLEKITHNY